MTEQEWLECADPQQLLEFMRAKASVRKLRLFTCACARRVPFLMAIDELKQVLESADRRADASTAQAELQAAIAVALQLPGADRTNYTAADGGFVHFDLVEDLGIDVSYTEEYYKHERHRDAVAGALWATLAVWKATWPESDRAYEQTLRAVRRLAFARTHEDHALVEPFKQECTSQAGLLREIVGNPFRPITLDRSRLTATALAIAQAIYEERQFDRLPILADALEEAGVVQPDLLNHCRQPGEHVKGCWALDLVLGRE